MMIKEKVDMTGRADRLKRFDRTLLELYTGILVFGIVCQCAALPFPLDRGRYACGLWSGILAAGLSAFHMWYSLNRAFECDERAAARKLAGGYAVRYLVTAVFLLLLHYTGAGYLLAGFLGVMGLKAGALMQPVTHRFFNWLFHETDPVAMPLAEDGGEDFGDKEE